MTSYTPGYTTTPPTSGFNAYYPQGGIGLQGLMGATPAQGGLVPGTPAYQAANLAAAQRAGLNVQQAGGGQIAGALQYATPQQRALYEAEIRKVNPSFQFAQQPAQPQFSGGVVPVGQIEPFNTYQRQGLQQLAGGMPDTGYLSGAQQAFQGAMGAMQPGAFDQGVQKYLNPYISNVADQATRRIQEQSDIMANKIKAANPSAFGNSAYGVQQAALNKDTLQQVGDITSSLYASGFESAADRALGDVGRYSNLAQLGFQGQGAAYTDFANRVQGLLGAGGMMQDQNQRLLDVARGEIYGQRDYPVTSLQNIASLLAPFSGSTSTGAQTGNSTTQQLGGLGMILGGQKGFNSLQNYLGGMF